MKRPGEKGITLVELLIAIAIMALIIPAATGLFSSALQGQGQGDDRSGLYQEGLLAMERMVKKVQACTYLLIPNAHNATRDILAVSGFVNDDGDYYFGDTLFPRIDEDTGPDMNADSSPGIQNIDDDGDSTVDDGGTNDDDEDGTNDEDPLDGIDNDEDGLIDEDFAQDASNDATPGIKGMDDDGNGTVDEGNFKDDDEDGSSDEDPLNALLYLYDSGSNTLTESSPATSQSTVLSSRVTNFQVTSGTTNCVLITLTLTGEDGESVTFSEYVYPRNILQKTGKRVR
jgi:prepilin-type N-terminal cleavage/methylation domain-containing protein